jgi:hypothetical protein
MARAAGLVTASAAAPAAASAPAMSIARSYTGADQTKRQGGRHEHPT